MPSSPASVKLAVKYRPGWCSLAIWQPLPILNCLPHFTANLNTTTLILSHLFNFEHNIDIHGPHVNSKFNEEKMFDKGAVFIIVLMSVV